MKFYQQLQQQTEAEQKQLMSVPIITAGQRGELTLEVYVAFLAQAYYHVRHTVPLLMSAGGRLPQQYEWVRGAIAEYIEEEYGHQEWILNDIRTCGGDAELVKQGNPSLSIELMVSFLYDQINRQNPMAIFGMVHVLEGTSVVIATPIADKIRESLNLPKKAMTYLSSHGALDQEHLKFFESLMNKVEDPADQEAIIHSAKIVYQLYSCMLYGLMDNRQCN